MKTPTQQFIEDAIAGGYMREMYGLPFGDDEQFIQRYLSTLSPKPDHSEHTGFMLGWGHGTRYAYILLDPLAWQAVGKTRGWGSFYDEEGMPRIHKTQGWYPNTAEVPSGKDGLARQAYQHVFIDHLADGKTIDEALGAIST